jgi:hypothetical protein
MKLRFALTLAAVLLASGAAFAEDPAPPPPADPTTEQRQQMAETHRKMAECLASTRPIAECHAEMHASCQANHMQGCPMLGAPMGGGMGRGMRHGPGAMGTAPTPPLPTDAPK